MLAGGQSTVHIPLLPHILCYPIYRPIKDQKVGWSQHDLNLAISSPAVYRLSYPCTHTVENPYLCDVCDKTFASSCNLGYHARSHTGEKRFKCAICDNSFANKTTLMEHARTHTGKKPCKCHFCDMMLFSQTSGLACHLRTHTGETPYKCVICDTSFSQQGSLPCHARIYTGEQFACGACQKSFAHPSALARHKARQHCTTTNG